MVGLSKLRSPRFTGLALDERLAAEGIPGGCCGLRVVDLATGALPGVRQPLGLGLQEEDIHGLVRLPDPGGQMRVRPQAPSGNPCQAPAAAPFGRPEVSPVAPGAGQSEAGLAVPDPTTVAGPIRYQKVLLLTRATLPPYAALTCPCLAPGSAALERISGELLGLCALVDGAMVALAIAERRSDGDAQLISLMVAPTWRRRGIGTGLLRRLQPFFGLGGNQRAGGALSRQHPHQRGLRADPGEAGLVRRPASSGCCCWATAPGWPLQGGLIAIRCWRPAAWWPGAS